jgi:hypothetical protein
MFQTEIEFLGFKISQHGISMEPGKVDAITNWPAPSTVKHVRSFLGMAGFYRSFVKGFSSITAPLTSLLQKSSTFTWTTVHQPSFEQLKLAITSAPTLALPRDELEYVVHTDASGFATGAVLMQDAGKGLQPIGFISHKMLPAEQRYPMHEQELLSIVIALKTWRHYLYGRKFKIYTDHHSLVHFGTQQTL